jgi:CubicO group peptidase (beta-lactamase class C family)
MSNAPAVYILAIQQNATSMNTKQCLHAATVALASTLSLMNPVAAEPKQQIYGKDQTSPFEAGWPLRTNPPNRLGAFDGRGIEALYGKKPVWMEPATNGAPMQSAVVSFGFRHDPADLMKRYPIMAMALGKDGKLVFERYQFGTSKSSTFDSQSIAKFLTGLTVGALIQKGTAVDLDTKMLTHVRGLEKSPIGLATVRQTLQMQCGHQFKWADDGTSEGSAGQYAGVRFAAAAKGGRNLFEYFQTLTPNTPGQTFAYDPHCSDSISMLISEKTGMPQRKFFEEAIWKKIGATSRAAWLSPSQNPELTSGASAFYATLPDYALLANMVVQGGESRGEAVISGAWLEKMRTDTVPVGKDENQNFTRYGYQAWVRTDKADSWFAGLGNYGQRFYMDPKNKSFMIIFALDFDHIKESDIFWEWFRTTPMDKL